MLINCASYQNGKKIADIDIENISDHIADKNSFVWVALLDPTVDEIAKMKEEFDLHPLAVEDALLGHQRPKIEEYGKSLFAVIQVLKYDDDISVGELDIFAASDYVLSIRNRSDVGFLGVRQRCEQEPELLSQGSGFVLYALIDAVVDRYFPIVERLELELENIEETLFDERSTKSNIERLFELKRKVMVVKHAVSPLMEAVGKLSSGRVPPICANSTEYFRDILDHLTRINPLVVNSNLARPTKHHYGLLHDGHETPDFIDHCLAESTIYHFEGAKTFHHPRLLLQQLVYWLFDLRPKSSHHSF
jgi:magnesium transporter